MNNMTKRERYLCALRNERVDELVWAPNFDYWLSNNRAAGTLPEKYAGMHRNDIVRAVGGYIWNRSSGLRRVLDGSVREQWSRQGDRDIYQLHTPLGSVSEIHQRTESAFSSKAVVKHMIEDLDTLRVMRYIAEATHYEQDFAPTIEALAETGEDGVVLNSRFCVPFLQFAKNDAGYVNGFYLWADYPEQVQALVDVYTRNYLEGVRLMSDGPCDVIAMDDNMDGTTMSPALFERFGIPYYQELKKITAPKGKILEAHWCGRTQTLLHLVKHTGLDVVEAVVPRPMADISIAGILEKLDGKTVFQGGLPSVLMVAHGASRAQFDAYIETEILPQKGRAGFILGMSDNVPPDADFSRVEAVAGLIR